MPLPAGTAYHLIISPSAAALHLMHTAFNVREFITCIRGFHMDAGNATLGGCAVQALMKRCTRCLGSRRIALCTSNDTASTL